MTFAMHSILSPVALVFATIWQEEDATTIPLTITMLTHVLDKIRVERDAHARHLIIFIHALVAESILKQTRADAVLLILCVNLAIEHLVILLDSDKVFVDF